MGLFVASPDGDATGECSVLAHGDGVSVSEPDVDAIQIQSGGVIAGEFSVELTCDVVARADRQGECVRVDDESDRVDGSRGQRLCGVFMSLINEMIVMMAMSAIGVNARHSRL